MTAGKKPTFALHGDSGFVLIDGQDIPLQHKAQQVLARIATAAPDIVPRRDLIDEIWNGNYLTGEKGLRQAVWAIRAAIGDSAVAPQLIRTIPRTGYQWIGPPVPDRQLTISSNAQRPWATILASCLIALIAVLGGTSDSSSTNAESVHASPVPQVASARLQNNYIVVDYTTGCRRVIRSDTLQLIGDPVVSADRKQVIFPVVQNNSCKLVLFEPASDRISKFGSCPSNAADIRT